MNAELAKSAVLFETLAMTAYPLLRSTTVTMLVGHTNDGVAFLMTYLQWLANVRRAFAQRPAVGDLSPAVSTTGVALSLLLLAPQALPQGAAMLLVCISMQVKRFMAHWQLAGDLLWAPFQPQQRTGLLFTQGASELALLLDSGRLQASSQACLAL